LIYFILLLIVLFKLVVHLYSTFEPGNPTAHESDYLPLLSSEPDGVHRLPLRRTQFSSPLAKGRPYRSMPIIGIRPCYSGLQVTGHRYLPV